MHMAWPEIVALKTLASLRMEELPALITAYPFGSSLADQTRSGGESDRGKPKLIRELPIRYLPNNKGDSRRAIPLNLLERETGFEPATLSLEG